ncbi:MAG TPA: hypothetical protein VLB29_19645 [Nocardioidaceae bacterium]|nr:hypothetical protein [Nocardioidaceae bacterium]
MFIQIIQGKCTKQDELHAQFDKWLRDLGPSAPGWLGGTFGFTDDNQFVGVVRFEDKEKAMANSDRPEQGQWWAETERLFDGPVEFHNADKVLLMLQGGSDDAQFVQILQGKLDDPARLEAEMDDMTNMLHKERPEILGSTFAIEEDGTFTEAVFFTDEKKAREGEAKAMPNREDVRELMEDWRRMTHDVKFMDLHHPWFASR